MGLLRDGEVHAGRLSVPGGGTDGSPLMRSPYKFEKRGECGMDVSELFSHLGGCVDDMCFVRSLTCDSNSHTPALFQMNTGTTQQGFPSFGAWLLYGLGSENPDLPGFCVMVQKNALVNGGPAAASGARGTTLSSLPSSAPPRRIWSSQRSTKTRS